MIINLQTYKSDLKSRVDYLLYGIENSRSSEKVDILYGDADLFLELSKLNPYKRKSYNYLISFAESKEELEKKLKEKGKTIEELFDEILDYLIYPYRREDLNIFAVGHSDTDNYHIHLTIENKHYALNRSLRIPLTELEVKLFLLLSEYFREKYDLEFHYEPISQGPVLNKKKKKILELKGLLKCKERDEFKEELTNHLLNLIFEGVITSREELVSYLKNDVGFKTRRKGRNYITIAVDGFRIRLKGGIYDEEHFRKVFEEVERNRERVREYKEELLREFEKRLRRIQEKRAELIRKYYRKSLKRNKEIFRKDLTEGAFENKGRNKNLEQDLNFGANNFISNDRNGDRVLHSKSISISLSNRSNRWREVLGGPGNNLQAERGKESVRTRRRTISNPSRNLAEEKLKRLEKFKELLKDIGKEELEIIKNIDPEEVFNILGISDYKKAPGGYYYLSSPLREDKNPSFVVFYGTKRNAWIYYDHGTGWSGTLIDLWQEIYGLSYEEAVKELREIFNVNLLKKEKLKVNSEFSLKEVEENKQKLKENLLKLKEKNRFQALDYSELKEKLAFKVLEVKNKVENEKLLAYLKERKIKKIPSWLKEIRFKSLSKNKVYYGLAVENVSGAYHVRNPYGKYVVFTAFNQENTFSLIKKKKRNKKVIIVEGLFDALSVEQMENFKDFDIIILNSVNNVKKLLESKVLKKYETVILALDDDEAGKKAEEILLKNVETFASYIGKLKYSEKDINEVLIKAGSISFEILREEEPLTFKMRM